MSEAHSKFSASAAVRWMSCPGSITLSAGKADKTSRYAAEGTAAHTLMAWCLQDNKDASAFHGRMIEADGFEFEVDDEMVDNVQCYVDQVREYAIGADAVMVERRVNYSKYLSVDEADGFGTSDTLIAKGNLLIVDDLKYGRGNEVEAEENVQMKLYALGAIAEFEGITDFERVLMVIHQPRISRKPKEFEIGVPELLAWAKAVAEPAAMAVFDARHAYPDVDWHDKFTKASPEACKYCRAKATCPTLRETVTDAVFDQQPATPEEFEVLTATTLDKARQAADGLGAPISDWVSVALLKVDLIEDWCAGVRAEMETLLLSGVADPNWKLVKGKKGNRAWSNKEEAEAAMKSFRLKQEEMYDFKLISPTTAEKLAKAKTIGARQWPKLQTLITQPDGKLHVAPISDPREAITVTPVDDEFEVVAALDTNVDDLA